MLVTGASGGIGSACARAFAGEGARVLVHYHRGEERAHSVAKELGGAPVAQADLTVEHEVERLFEEARAALEQLIGQSQDWSRIDEYLISYLVEPAMRSGSRRRHYALVVDVG